MAVLSEQIGDFLNKSSWIRRMFDAGAELKRKHGEDRVCDFSLGNPDLPAPQGVRRGLEKIASRAGEPYCLGYMPNPGFPGVRDRLAEYLTTEQGVSVAREDVMLSCGAAGGINCLLRAVLEPGEEVICPTPHFVEYGFYLSNHGGTLKPVPAREDDFSLDIEAIERAFTERTRMVLINSPNNPTGQVYSESELKQLGDLLRRKNAESSRPVLLVSDEPYRFLTYDGHEVPSVLQYFENSVVVSSFSKNLSLAGERIGYVLLHPDMPHKTELMDGLVYTNRILGYVNAPTLGQQVIDEALGEEVDTSVYVRRRDKLADILSQAGYEFHAPKGGFYFFPKAPGGDDVEFTRVLQDELVLAVPGSGFGGPGHFRLSFCVPDRVIDNSAPGFQRAMERISGK